MRFWASSASLTILDTSQYTFPGTVRLHVFHACSRAFKGLWTASNFSTLSCERRRDFFPNPLRSRFIASTGLSCRSCTCNRKRGPYNDYGEWSDPSVHIVGRSEDEVVHFDAAVVDGLSQPWAMSSPARFRLGPDGARSTGTVSRTSSTAWLLGTIDLTGGQVSSSKSEAE